MCRGERGGDHGRIPVSSVGSRLFPIGLLYYPVYLVSGQHLHLHERIGDPVEDAAPGFQSLLGLLLGVHYESPYLLVHEPGHVLAVALGLGELSAEEGVLLAPAEVYGAHLIAHAPLGYHLFGKGGGLFQVVLGARGDVFEDEPFRDPPGQRHGELVHEVRPRVIMPVLLWKELCGAHGHAPRYYGHLVYWVHVRQAQRHEGVSRFVVGGYAFFLLAYGLLPRGAHEDLVAGLLEVRHLNELFIHPRGCESGLVRYVLEVGPRHPRGPAGDPVEVHIRGELLSLHVNIEYAPALLQTRPVYYYVSGEPPGPQERRVEDVGPVGGGHDDHLLVGLQTVHLAQELVQRLLPLVVAASEPGAAGPAHGVRLGYEYYARLGLLS